MSKNFNGFTDEWYRTNYTERPPNLLKQALQQSTALPETLIKSNVSKDTTGEGKVLKTKQNKYRNVKTIVDDFTFDSCKEADYYTKLKLLKEACIVVGFSMQVTYHLEVQGQLICKYKADFVVTYHKDLKIEVVDVKSAMTRKLPVYRIKQKLMKALFNIEIVEV